MPNRAIGKRMGKPGANKKVTHVMTNIYEY